MSNFPFGIVITCEHAGNRVPAVYRRLFSNRSGLLSSHRGFDIGAKELAKQLAAHVHREPVAFEQTRLLVDVNRSLSNPSLFSSISATIPSDERRRILETYYHPYRNAVQREIENHVNKQKPVIHLSVHTFTPVFKGVRRNTDIGLLYNPSRDMEKCFCLLWKNLLLRTNSALAVHRNAPYRGVSDGLASFFRRRYSDKQYLGIELEVNQKYPQMKHADWRSIQKDLTETFYQAVESGLLY